MSRRLPVGFIVIASVVAGCSGGGSSVTPSGVASSPGSPSAVVGASPASSVVTTNITIAIRR